MAQDRWGSPPAGAGDVELLLWRSNALGSDLAVTNYAGGNTSCKTTERDPVTGEPAELLWVKGSGGDLGTLTRGGLACLRMDRLRALRGRYRGVEHEDEMASLLMHATVAGAAVPPSIDTPLHAFVPFAHADHLHPDAVIAIAACADAEELTRRVFGDDVVYTPYRRPGWELGMIVSGLAESHPGALGIVLGGHGLLTWGNTARECYANSIAVVSRAEDFLRSAGAAVGSDAAFGAVVRPPRPQAERRAVAAGLGPRIRGMCSAGRPLVAAFRDDEVVLDFLSRSKAPDLAALGTSCPDHFIRTRVRPLWADVAAGDDALAAVVDAYRLDYEAYYRAHADDDAPPMRGSEPRIVLVPGVGMWSLGETRHVASVAGEYFVNAINVMRGAEAVSRYSPIPEQEKFRIEYWPLEVAKLARQPAPPRLGSRVALVTGGASGIGRATALRLSAEGACVVVADLAADRARAVADQIGGVAVAADLSDEAAVRAAVDEAVLAFGGLDIVVHSAGLARSARLADTTAADWDLLHGVLARGSFLVAREAARVMQAQGTGGDIVLVVSKNAVAATPDNAAYGAAKAAQAHLVRLLATDLGPDGIRVNGVNPDAVVQGSGIFSGDWAAQRAAAHGVTTDELGDFYAKRTLLGAEILPEDVAGAIFVLVSGDLTKTTGTIIPVDGGVPSAFLR